MAMLTLNINTVLSDSMVHYCYLKINTLTVTMTLMICPLGMLTVVSNVLEPMKGFLCIICENFLAPITFYLQFSVTYLIYYF